MPSSLSLVCIYSAKKVKIKYIKDEGYTVTLGQQTPRSVCKETCAGT